MAAQGVRAQGGREAARVVALVPAHNEADCIEATLAGLAGQTVRPTRVVVVADNCTDDTAELAVAAGASVVETVGNSYKKAGALNQALARILPELRPHDYVLILDADTLMVPDFVEVALSAALRDPLIGAVGGIFHGERAGSVLEQAQCNEYARYAREIDRVQRVMVLTGTAALIRVEALRDVASHRGTSLPGRFGDFYDRTALTEDMELTLALKTRRWLLLSPTQCRTVTELMPNRRALHRQRVRWYRGALDNLRVYGWTPVTRRYWGQQVMLALGSLVMSLYLLVTTVAVSTGSLQFSWFWTAVGFLFALERVVTAWSTGWKGRALAVLLLPELAYDLHLQWAFIRAVIAHLRGEQAAWHHLTTAKAS